MKARWLLVALVATGVAGRADDERKDDAKPKGANEKSASADEAAIRSLVEGFGKAFNAGDAGAIARLHTPDARLIDVAGEVAEGRDAIEREYAALFKENPGLAIEVKVESLRLLGPGAAIEEGTTRVVPKDGAPPVVNRYSAIDVKRNGQWLLADVREAPGEVPAQDRLRALDFLLGEWVDESGDSSVRASCRWSDDKQALVREFTIRTQGKVVMSGTQRIGWDPRGEQFKSWEFDSEGGHGEGLWARVGNHWIVKATAVLQDGRNATATHVITPESPSACRWRTTDRTIGGHVVPVTDEYVMVRPGPGPQGK
jgi:uncharacterized protein (TIGR02246 family)